MESARRASPRADAAIAASASSSTLKCSAPSPRVSSPSARRKQKRHVGVGQRLEPEHAAAREERGVDGKRRVFGGGADEGDRALLDVRQECVLLRLVEAMNLVDEEDGACAFVGAGALGFVEDGAQLGDAAEHGAEGHELDGP